MFSIVNADPNRNCAQPGTDPDDWFPKDEPARTRPLARARYIIRARGLCGGCPVEAECLTAALHTEAADKYTPAGIYGGYAPWERAAMAKRLTAAGTSVPSHT